MWARKFHLGLTSISQTHKSEINTQTNSLLPFRHLTAVKQGTKNKYCEEVINLDLRLPLSHTDFCSRRPTVITVHGRYPTVLQGEPVDTRMGKTPTWDFAFCIYICIYIYKRQTKLQTGIKINSIIEQNKVKELLLFSHPYMKIMKIVSRTEQNKSNQSLGQ